MTPDPMYRQRLRNSWRDTVTQMQTVDRGSRAFFKFEALERSISALYLELYKEAINPQTSVPPPSSG
jgi:hypothetical protein